MSLSRRHFVQSGSAAAVLSAIGERALAQSGLETLKIIS